MNLIQNIGMYVCAGALALGVGCAPKHVETPDYQPLEDVILYDQSCLEPGSKIAAETSLRIGPEGHSIGRKVTCYPIRGEEREVELESIFPKTPNNTLYAASLLMFLEKIPSIIADFERITLNLNTAIPSEEEGDGRISCSEYETLSFLLHDGISAIRELGDAVQVTYERSDPHPVLQKEREYDFMIDELNTALGDLREAREPYEEACDE